MVREDKNMRRSQATRRSQFNERLLSSVNSYKSPVSRFTNATMNYEQEELRAVQRSEHLFDKWCRNIKTAFT